MYTVKICKPYGDHLVEAQRVNVSRSTNAHYWQSIAMKLCSNDPEDAESLINLARGGDDLQVPTSFVWFYEEGSTEPQYVWVYESEAVYIMNAKGVTIEKVYSTYTATLGDTLGMEDGKPTTKTLRERLLEEFGGAPKTTDDQTTRDWANWCYTKDIGDDSSIAVYFKDKDQYRVFLKGVRVTNHEEIGNLVNSIKLYAMSKGQVITGWERKDLDVE